MAGIYVHVPFCHSKCAYCDFYSIARAEMSDRYAKAVIKEYAARQHELDKEVVETLYFGGGTPSILAPNIFAEVADTLYADSISEFTIEVNPEDVTEANINCWEKCGVNRVSIGVQSLDNSELKTVGRRHSAYDALRAIELFLNAGITNISADLIYGLPGQTAQSWRNSVHTLITSGISHLSAYCLSYEEGTLLYRRLMRGDITEASEELIEEYYNILCASIADAGFVHYEISNFALPGFKSRHNSAYWTGAPYLGLGPGAHSLDNKGLRRYNRNDVRQYITSPADFTSADEESFTDRINDTIMISLRTAEGLNLQRLDDITANAVLKNAKFWLNDGRLRHDGHRLFIPENAWLMADAIIRDLFLD